MKKQQKNPKQSKKLGRPAGAIAGVKAGKDAALAKSKFGRNSEPQIQKFAGGVRIRHREFLSTISGSVAFAVAQSVVIQPGLAASFPWLSTQASGWEQYRFHKLKYSYISRSAATRDGTLLMAPDYDVLDPAPQTEQVAGSYRDAVEDSSWEDIDCPLDCASMFAVGPRKYIRTTFVAGADPKTYDCGQMHVCVVGQADSAAVGKLWVEYDIEMFVPQTVSSGAVASPTSFAQFNLSTNQGLTTATVATLGFDETVVNALGIANITGSFSLPQGNWEISGQVQVSGGTGAGGIQTVLSLEKDGAAMSIPVSVTNNYPANATGVIQVTTFQGYIQSNGSSTCRLRITVTSASGTLVAVGDACRILFQVV